MSRLAARAGPTPPAAPPTSCGRRWDGCATPGPTDDSRLRADSGFYTHGVVSVCRKMDVRFSITIRQHKSLRNLIEAIPEDAWTPIPYWMDGAADVAETTCTPFQSEPDAAPVRLIVRRVKPHARFPAGPLRHLPYQPSSPTAMGRVQVDRQGRYATSPGPAPAAQARANNWRLTRSS